MNFQFLRKLAAREGFRATLILVVVLQICFWPCFWGGKTLLTSAGQAPSILLSGADTGPPELPHLPKLADPGAAAWQTEPWFAFSRDQYRQGILPLWDPYQAYGGPLAANMQSQPFYPLTMALFLHLTPRSYNFYILGRLFIAGICAYFYIRLFLSFIAAIAAGIGSMLTGYYILYLTMPHLSVEVLLPVALLAGEYVLRQRSYKAVAWLAIVVMLVFLGGMPESAVVLLTFAAAYLLFRVISDPELRPIWRRCIGLLSTGAFAALGLSSFLLVPFYEYMAHSSNSHAPPYMPGIMHDKLDLSALTYFFPLLFGPVYTSSAFAPEEFRNYVGILSVFLIVIAVACVLIHKSNERSFNSLTYFFFVAASVMVLKRYGFLGINWIGKLPYYSLVEFRKYDEPVLAFCIWVLCAIGIERLTRRQASVLIQAIALTITTLVLLLAVMLTKSNRQVSVSMHRFAIRLPEALLVLLLLAIIVELWSQKAWIGVMIAVLMALELSLNYIVPLYRIYDRPPSIRRNPYEGGAFVRFLQANSEGGYRVFGRNWILTPSWATVFRLFDIRDMDALYYKKYFPFLRNFIGPEEHVPTDLVSSFFGNGPYTFRLPLEQRLLQLSSVKYLATMNPFVAHEGSPSFKLVYDAEAKIYEYDNVLPRAAIYYDVDVEQDETAVLRRLADPALDVFRTVVLDASKLSKSQAVKVHLQSSERVDAARIKSYESQNVEIEATLKRSGILVLNDSNYPGWRVSVDRHPSDWFQADYLFRGVSLGPGTHVVRFEYRPASFYGGAAVSLLTCGFLAGLLAYQRRAKVRAVDAVLAPS